MSTENTTQPLLPEAIEASLLAYELDYYKDRLVEGLA